MNIHRLCPLVFVVAFGLTSVSLAQTNPPAAALAPTNAVVAVAAPTTNQSAVAVVSNHVNAAIVPAPRGDERSRKRTDIVLQRAKDNPGKYDVVFIGDSITQGWEVAGSNVWKHFYGHRKCLNFGVGGDRTEHVLWRYAQGQLDGLKPKVAVIMIGTNNSNKNKDGTEQYSEADILEGVQAVVRQTRERLPKTKIILCAIFPRSSTFSAQRGKILQVNQALAKLDDGKDIFYIDFGSQLIEADGSISKAMMHDALHPGERGYEIWAQAIEPKLKKLL